MTIIIAIAATLAPVTLLSKKKIGRPINRPPPKQISCLFVRLKSTLVFTLVKSLGTLTYAISFHLRQWALNTDLARLLVLNRQKHSSTVYPMHVQMALLMSSTTAIFCTSTA